MEELKVRHSDNLWFGVGDGKLLQWSLRQRKVTKHYGHVSDDSIIGLKTMADRKHLFIVDVPGT